MRPPQELTASRAPAAPSRLKLLFSIKNWRIRTRITALLLLPVVVAALLGGLRIQSSVDKTREMDVVQKAADVINESTTLVAFLEEERDMTAKIVMSGGSHNDPNIVARNQATEAQFERFKAAVAKMDLDNLPLIRATIKSVTTQMVGLSTLRRTAFTGNPVQPAITVSQYGNIIETLLSINQRAPEVTRNPDLIQGARVLGLLGELKAGASSKRALLTAYLAAPTTAFADAPAGLARAGEQEGDSVREFTAVAPREAVQAYNRALEKIADASESVYIRVKDVISKQGDVRPAGEAKVNVEDWWKLSSDKISALTLFETNLGNELQTRADELRDESRQEALINTIFVIAALLFTIILGVIVARSLVRSLNTLRRSALEIAEQRLPETVRRLSEADPADIDLTVAPIGVATRDEVGQVARAFDAVHAEAVRLAAEQALLRGNVNSMFVNLSRRSQSLIQRQLALISDLENREADPDQLANLFKLDHLATRMRRNGENLLVLAGEEPGRRWTRPVPLVDVLRAAASEVEQYERVELGALPTTDIAGRAVNDLVHLLAELLENSTTFSSPHTKVRVTGHILPDGRALIEIHDNGIGLTGDDLADANQRLARPPVVDVSISRRMGLFVVGRLSTRHGIRVQLRPGDGGGTTALVMLPIELIQGDRPGGNWDKSNGGRPAVAAGWEPDALTASQEMQALPAAAAGPQRPGPDAGRSEAPRPLPQRGAQIPGQIPGQNQSGAYEAATAFAPDGPATHDTPFPGTPFAAPATDADNPFAPVSPQGRRGVPDARPAGGDTAQFPPPFGTEDRMGREAAYPQYDQTPAQPMAQPASADYGQPPAYGRPDYEQPYQQPRFDPEPVEHSGNDRGAGLPRRGGDAAGMPQGEQQRATAWAGPEYDGLAPVSPPQQMPAYEAPQRRDDARDTGAYPAQPQPGYGDALPALRQTGMPVRQPQPTPVPQQTPQQMPQQQGAEGLFRDGSGRPQQSPQQTRPGQAPGAPRQLGQGPQGLPTGQPGQAPQLPQSYAQQPPPARPLAAQPEALDALDAPALPMTVEDERSPIFETLESDWFHRRTGRGGRMRAAQVRSAGRPDGGDEAADTSVADQPQELRTPAATNSPLPQHAPEQTPQQAPLPRRSHAGPAAQAETPGMPLRQAAHAAPTEQTPAPAAPQPGRPAAEPAPSGWYSAGDEGWRAAEAAREPASSGTTTAGLPRRVPRANLVPGGVQNNPAAAPGPGPGAPAPAPYPQQQSTTPGGQADTAQFGAFGLSRSPDDVRGRLTNFRRGIQQGRTAGAGGRAPQPRDENNQEQA